MTQLLPIRNVFAYPNMLQVHEASLTSQHIIETASYTTTRSSTPSSQEVRPASSVNEHHRAGLTTESIVEAIHSLETYRQQEEKRVKDILGHAVGNYQKAIAAQKTGRRQRNVAGDLMGMKGMTQHRPVLKMEELCPWKYEDQKRQMHMSMMVGTISP